LHILWNAALFVILAALQSLPAAAEKRVALVIGNSAYQNTTPLPNPRNDAEDMAAKLSGLGFEVVRGFDLAKPAMDGKIAEFLKALSGADVAVFFYGGHGLQVNDQNYLVPIDAKLQTASSLSFETVRLASVQQAMEGVAKTNIIFLDACRDNPLGRNLSRALGTRSSTVERGLAPVRAAIGTVISFSTQPGNVALDGQGRNSPFATALVNHLGDPESITDILMSVRNEVVTATRQQQVPWEHSALRANFFFAGPPEKSASTAAAAASAAPSPSADPAVEQQAELELWSAIDAKSPELLQSYLDQYPNGRFAGTARMMADLMKKEQEQAKLAEQRLVDARRAEEENRLATAQAAEAQQKAQAAKRDADYRLALEEAGKAREAAADAERRRIAAERAAADAQMAANAATAAREEKAKSVPAPPLQVATLPDAAAPPGSAPRPASTLAADVKQELKRVGCYAGAVDGTWDDSSRSALEAFANESGTKLAATEPALDVLNVLKRTKDRVCSVARATPESKPGRKKTQRASGSTQQRTSSSKSKSRGRDCTPIYGPYGAHPNPWCK
jgi:uncharacterized caspase-like protein